MLRLRQNYLPGSPTPLTGMRDAIAIFTACVSIGAICARAIDHRLSPIATAGIVFAALILVGSPLLWIRIAKPIVRAVEAERRRVLRRDAEQAVVSRRQEFDAQLGRALEFADSEEGVLEVVHRAFVEQVPTS